MPMLCYVKFCFFFTQYISFSDAEIEHEQFIHTIALAAASCCYDWLLLDDVILRNSGR